MEPYDQVFQRSQSIIKYLRNELNEEERNELEAWLSSHEDNRRLFEELTNEHALHEELKFFEDISLQPAWEKIDERTERKSKVMALQVKKGRWRFAAAAALLLILGSFIAYRFSVSRRDGSGIVRQKIQKPDVDPWW